RTGEAHEDFLRGSRAAGRDQEEAALVDLAAGLRVHESFAATAAEAGKQFGSARPIQRRPGGRMSRERAAELTKMRTELTDKFSEALKAIDARIAEESGGGEADDYAAVG